jgi:hypothetical protein
VGTVSRSLGLASLLAMSLSLPTRASAYQTGQSNVTDSETVSLKGTVVDSATGEPIHGALVQAYGAQTRSMLTGLDGKFDFEGMQPGNVVVRPRKPGYFGAYDLSPERQLLENIDLEASTPPIVLKLIPEGVIYGRVTSDNGEPVEDLAINVIYIHIVNGHKQREQRGTLRTDEEGGFRLAELQPGTYYVSAGPSESMTFPPPGNQGKVTQGYPLTFYPGVSDMESAAPITIKPGTHAELNFSPPTQPLYQVAGTVSGFLPNQGVNVGFASASGGQNFLPVQFNQQTGTFEVQAIPGGTYLVTATCQGPTQNILAATATINVNSNIPNLHLALAPVISIPVLFTLNLANPSQERPPAPAGVELTPTDPARMNEVYGSNSEPSGSWIHGIGPGSYSAEITSQGPWYVASATYGSTDLFRDPLMIAPGGAPGRIEIEVREDGATLNGTVLDGDQPAPGAVLVIPDRSLSQQRMVATDEHGNFQIEMLAPGNYSLLAFDRLDDLEYANPQALQQYATKEKSITLGSNGKAAVQLDLIRRGD